MVSDGTSLKKDFVTVMGWMKIDRPENKPNAHEMDMLKTSFVKVRRGQIPVMIVANEECLMVMDVARAVCVDWQLSEQMPLRNMLKEKFGTCVDRKGLLVINLLREPNLTETIHQVDMVNQFYAFQKDPNCRLEF